MTSINSPTEILAKKDQFQHAIPTVWRQVLRSIANAFAARDYGLAAGLSGVEQVSPDTALHIRDSIHSYGATLVSLPDEAWNSSVCMWYATHWDVLIDLWTLEEGRSDLVLNARVTETVNGYCFKIHMVYVP